MTYDQYYEFLKSQNGGTVAGMDMGFTTYDGIDPYEVLGVRKKFSWEELKNAYRKKAALVHPDKGGSEQLFNLITDCFRKLANEYKMNLETKSHYDLKKESQDFYNKNAPPPVATRKGRGGKDEDDEFFKKFNRMFEENKLEDEGDVGYGHVMEKSTGKRDDIEIPKLLNKFNKDKFNKQFDKHVPLTKDVVVYKEPQPLTLAKTMAYTELGGKTDDFSSSVEQSEKRSLHYTDYMKAHTTSRLVDPRAVATRKEYRNVEEYEADRTRAVDRAATEDERRWMEERDENEKQIEYDRIERLKQRDAAIASHYERVNGLLMR